MQTKAYAIDSPDGKFHPWEVTRRNVGESDVHIEIIYAGICHSDIHSARGEWGHGTYPMVPGHEIVGKVVGVGSKVTKFKVGDTAGVGCFVDSCRECDNCKGHEEQFCKKGMAATYNSTEMDRKTPTYGGYSTQIVVREECVIKVPDTLTKLEGIAPLFCAGITMFSPLNRFGVLANPGMKVGIVGLGGLGHMAIKLAAAMKADVTVFSTSPSKEKDAKDLGANHFVVSKDEEAMKKLAGTLDVVLDSVSADHPIDGYINCLRKNGTFVVIGAPPTGHKFQALGLLFGNKFIAGSLIGGIKETQEMIDFCGKHGIYSDVEIIKPEQIDVAYDRVVKADVKYRFVIDVSSLKN